MKKAVIGIIISIVVALGAATGVLLWIKAGNSPSEPVISLEAEKLLSVPVFLLEPGQYEGQQTLELKTDKPENTIYYTTDGSNPDEKSIKYTEPISLNNGATTVKAVAVNGAATSKIVEAQYTVTLKPEEIFLENISGCWVQSADGNDKNSKRIWYYDFVNGHFDFVFYGTYHEAVVKSSGVGGNYAATDVSADGTQGTLVFDHVVNTIVYEDYEGDQMGKSVERAPVVIDCGAIGDSAITIDGKEYTFVPGGIPDPQ